MYWPSAGVRIRIATTRYTLALMGKAAPFFPIGGRFGKLVSSSQTLGSAPIVPLKRPPLKLRLEKP